MPRIDDYGKDFERRRSTGRLSSTRDEAVEVMSNTARGDTLNFRGGTSNSRLALGALGYPLTLRLAEAADRAIDEVLKEAGAVVQGDELSRMSPPRRNAILKKVDRVLRKEVNASRKALDEAWGPSMDKLRGTSPAFEELYQQTFGSSTDRAIVGDARTFVDGHQEVGRQSTMQNVPIDVAMGSTISKLNALHDKNRSRGTMSPDYERDVDYIAKLLRGGYLELQKPQGTSLHHMIDWLRASPNKSDQDMPLIRMLETHFHSFVVEHDWAKAFEGTEDFEGGEVQLPYDFTCFEFRISGLRVLVPLGTLDDGRVVGTLITGLNRNWYINATSLSFTPDGRLVDDDAASYDAMDAQVVNEYVGMLGRQIRAVCIMLDAKVAEARTVEPSEGLNRKRAKEGRPPVRSYHVVSLTRRHADRHERGDGTGGKKRLHWRRGHWRHFKNPTGQVPYYDDEGISRSKTWIAWMLVGDPDLGFVDKHYKL